MVNRARLFQNAQANRTDWRRTTGTDRRNAYPIIHKPRWIQCSSCAPRPYRAAGYRIESLPQQLSSHALLMTFGLHETDRSRLPR